ncbi:hypothetical protein PFISCL1PPCAC_22321, partial [Pristionchus fissidentatus]
VAGPPVKKRKMKEIKKRLPFPLFDLPAKIVEKILGMVPKEAFETLRCDFRIDELETKLMSRQKIEWIKIFCYGAKFLNVSTSDGVQFAAGMDDSDRGNFPIEWCERKTTEILKRCDIESARFEFIDGSKPLHAELIKKCTAPNIENLTVDYTLVHSAISDILTDGFLRHLMRTKKCVTIKNMCEELTAEGIFDLYKEWLKGDLLFTDLFFSVPSPLIKKLSQLLKKDGHIVSPVDSDGPFEQCVRSVSSPSSRHFVLEWSRPSSSGSNVKFYCEQSTIAQF